MDPIYAQALKILNLLEAKCGAYSLEAGGIPIWWFVRYKFFLSLLEKLNSAAVEKEVSRYRAIPVRNFINTISFGLRSLKSFAMIAAGHKKKPVWLLAYSGDLKKTKNGKFEDINIDPVYQKLEECAIVIEMPSLMANDFHSFLHRKEAFFFDAAIAVSIIFNFAKSRKKPVIVQWEEFNNLCRQTDFGHDYPSSDWISDKIFGLINQSYAKVLYQIWAAKFFLKKFKPDVIVETSSYDSGMMAINFAAKKMGIPAIEMQHGIITNAHAGYIYSIPQEYVFSKPLPEKFMAHGRIYKDIILASGNEFSSKDIVIAGNMRMEKFMRESLSGREAIRKKVRQALGVDENAFLAVVSSENLPKEGFARIMEETMAISEEDLFICIKLHPAEDDWRQAYGNILFHPRARFVTDGDIDLYELLVASDLHATTISTVFLECLALGIPNIIIESPNMGSVLDLVSYCGISPVKTAGEFVKEIHKIRSDKNYKTGMIKKGKEIAERFFTPTGYPENIIAREVLKKIKNKNCFYDNNC
ncbi:MAG: hypothetical protein L7H18_04400 [Candidatus Nealsonbacteria bacterium DGGOD1a]|nr:MAG: hypothetical protein L7H18_04400 [Candidatus Nealsonbacteria bacterium DGGOD1a]